MTIKCENMLGFLNVIYGLLQRGVQFKADQGTLTIELTGGY